MARAMSAVSDPYDLSDVEPELPADAAAVEALVLSAFGPGRFSKTAERLREGGTVAAGFVSRDDGKVVGSVRLWRIVVGETPALFLGPIAVDRQYRKEGLGAALVESCLNIARSQGLGVLLVGDEPYFGRFGFGVVPGVELPGPADRRRVLWWGENPPCGPVARG